MSGFAYQATRNGKVLITRHGKLVTTLTGGDAARFLNRVAGTDDTGAQQLMARATGQYKFGNERQAATRRAHRRR